MSIASRALAGAGAAIVLGCAALASSAGGQGGSELPPCDPNSPSALRLVVPESLPTGYRGGIHLDRTSPNRVFGSFEGITVAPAEGGRLTRSYANADNRRRDVFLRWRLQFEKGDGPARVSTRFADGVRDGRRPTCRRELSAVVRHEPMPDPRIRFRKRISRRLARRAGVLGVRWTVRVRGTIRKSAKRPILLELYAGFEVHRYSLETRKRVKPRRGRFAAALTVFTGGLTGPGGLHVRARYPGDLPERFPCADFFLQDEYCGSVSDPRRTD